MKTKVIFYMWGQKCETEFDPTSELDPYTWTMTMFEKGWILPIEIVREDNLVLHTADEFEIQ